LAKLIKVVALYYCAHEVLHVGGLINPYVLAKMRGVLLVIVARAAQCWAADKMNHPFKRGWCWWCKLWENMRKKRVEQGAEHRPV
jgi:hypothetical protein